MNVDGVADTGDRTLGADEWRTLLRHLSALADRDIIVLRGREPSMVYVSPGLCAHLQRRAEDLLGQPLGILSTRLERLASERSLGTSRTVSLQLTDPGLTVPLEVRASATRLGEGDAGLGVIALTWLEKTAPEHTTKASRSVRAEPGGPTAEEGAELLSQLAATFEGVFWVTDIHVPKVLYVSPQFQRVYGHPPDALYRDATLWLDMILPEDRDRAVAAFRAQANGHATDIEYRIQRPDGAVRWIRDRACAVRNPAGQIYRVAGIAEDVTERRAADESLHTLRQRLTDITENIDEVFWLSSIDKEHLYYISAAFERIWGISREQLRTAPWRFLEAVHPCDRNRVETAITTRQVSGDYDIEYRIVRPDGDVRWVSDRAFPVVDESGHVTRIAGVAKDITARKAAEHALREEKSFIGQALESLPGVFYVFDADGRMRRWNRRFEKVSGYSAQAIAELHPLDFIAPEQRGALRERIREILTYGNDVRIEAQLLTADGRRIPYLFTGERTLAHGTPYVVGLGVDISDRVRAEQALKESEARYRSFIEHTSEGIFSFGSRSPIPTDLPVEEQVSRMYAARVETSNDALARMYGFSEANDVIGLTLADLHGGDDIPENREFLRQWIRGGYRITDAETREVDRAGNTVWFSNSVVGVVEGGQLVRAWGSQTDITSRKEAEEALRLSASVFENTDEGVIITRPDATIVDANPAFSEITGYSRQEVIGATPRILKSGVENSSRYRELWQSLREVGHWRGELWNRRKDGALYPQWLTISSVYDNNGRLTHYVGVCSDISQIKHSEAQLDHLAHHDPLTDLPNRLLLNERLEHAIRQVERRHGGLAVVFLDIDHFKHLNDSLGHPVGDQLLCQLAKALTEAVRTDDTVARISGDEFVLVLEDITSADDASVTVNKLMAIFEQPFLVEEREVRITGSAGISLCPEDGADPATLLRNADAAMYLAKETGRNNYHFYTEDLTRRAYERMLMVNDLRKGLERDEFFLVYQPQIDLETGRVVGVEALIRWRHPERGLVLPGEFIPLAEESGLIHPLGQWVMRTACEQAVRWSDAGVAFGRMAINISGPQIQKGDLPEQVLQVLEDNGLPPDRLELEVTEGFIMQHTEQAVCQLNRLRTRGVMLAIDDFGTGHSSLSYLKTLPVHKLKLDKSFVQDIPDDHNDMAICAAVTALGNSLGLVVIAEGVETNEQASFLLDQRCRQAQGFYYSNALIAEDIHSFLERPKPTSGASLRLGR
ncbi:sensor domain-containing protein [Arhodomonas sp. AD133]|uniref:sensor domain-containing protein n=1 Tax=Arhodomonas sp. AD133 TaxID=3415009 RepID=UPI003EBD1E82